MIGAVTVNPALDKTMIVPGFAVGRTNRGQVERVDFGGKGINVARAVRQLGCPASAFGFMAAGEGPAVSAALAAEGIPNDFVYVPGETRVNLKIRDPQSGTETEINQPGFEVGPEYIERLELKIRDNAYRCSVMVFSGSLPPSLPPDTYAGFIRIARKCGARTILDTGGAPLKKGIVACPDLVKPNRAEAEELLGTRLESEEQLVRAARELMALGARMAVISLGEEGALGAAAGKFWRARPPEIKAASSIAAGDAMVAALACAMLGGVAFEEALRLAVAAGTATAAMSGSSVAGRALIDEILPRVAVKEVAEP